MIANYVVVCQSADVRDASRLNVECGYGYVTKEEAKAYVEKTVLEDRKSLIRVLRHDGVENPENHISVTKEETKYRCHYEVKADMKDYACLETHYDIVKLY